MEGPGGQAPGHHGGIFQLPRADGQVQPLRHQIQPAVGQHQVHLQIGIARQEIVHQRRHDVLAVGDRRGHPQQATGYLLQFGDRLLSLRQAVQQRPAVPVVHLPRLGHRYPAGGAVQQPGSQPLLQRADLAADLGSGYPQTPGRGGKAAGLHHRHEFTDAVPVHRRSSPRIVANE